MTLESLLAASNRALKAVSGKELGPHLEANRAALAVAVPGFEPYVEYMDSAQIGDLLGPKPKTFPLPSLEGQLAFVIDEGGLGIVAGRTGGRNMIRVYPLKGSRDEHALRPILSSVDPAEFQAALIGALDHLAERVKAPRSAEGAR